MGDFFADEIRLDEIVDADRVFAEEIPERRRGAQTAQAPEEDGRIR